MKHIIKSIKILKNHRNFLQMQLFYLMMWFTMILKNECLVHLL